MAGFAAGDPAGYTQLADTDALGAAGGVDAATAWHRNPGVLLAVCAADPGCAGVSSGGRVQAQLAAKWRRRA